jgi:hypothetical protein
VKIDEVRKSIKNKIVLGTILSCLSMPIFIVSVVKTFYLVSEELSASPIGDLIQKLIFKAVDYAPALDWLWPISPALNMNDLLSTGSLFFVFVYITLLIGISLIRNGFSKKRSLNLVHDRLETEPIVEEKESDRNSGLVVIVGGVLIASLFLPDLWAVIIGLILGLTIGYFAGDRSNAK